MNGHSGAYGFRFTYPEWDGTLSDLVELDESVPEVEISWRMASSIVAQEHVEEGLVRMGPLRGSSFAVRREPRSITFHLADTPNPDALVHPMGTVPLSVLARWRGDVTLHAGAFATEAGAWALAGEREAGKSTMLALLGQAGYPILADDLVAAHDGSVWSGPQCVDLRPDVAEHFAAARDLGMVGGRARWRLSTPPAPMKVPLRGVFLLDWHDAPSTAITPLPSAEWLKWLYRLEYIGLLGPADPQKLLALIGLPAWRVLRPRRWDSADEVVQAMLDASQAA